MVIPYEIPQLPPLAVQIEQYAAARPLYRFGYKEDGSIRLRRATSRTKPRALQKEVLRFLERKQSATRQDLIAGFPTARITSVERALNELIEKGIAERYVRGRYRLVVAS